MYSKSDTVYNTRCRYASKIVIDYETGTKSLLEGSRYLNKLLSRKLKTIHLNEVDDFILNLILPSPFVGGLTEACRQRFWKRKFVNAFGNSAPAVEEVTAGSLSEGLCLPEIIHMKRGYKSSSELPDEDTKYILHGLTVSAKNRNSFAFIEPTLLGSSMYVKLRLNVEYHYFKRYEGLQTDLFVNKNGFIVRRKFVAQIINILRKHIKTLTQKGQVIKCKEPYQADVLFSLHGPATTIDVVDEFKTVFSTDHVICLPCPVWPLGANAWGKRKRRWPSKGLVKKIVRNGCHIVPKSKKGSKDEEEQFSFSFSLCDKTLSTAMTLNQKKCYLLFKFVYKFYLNKIKRGLTSFFCKTTFLWTCESKCPSEYNDESVMRCLISLVKKLKEYLELRFLPHFYMAEFNLIEEMTDTATKACIKDIESFLQTPLQIVLQLADSYRFSWLSKDISLETVFQDLMDFTQLKTDVAIAPCILTFFSELLDKGEVPLVLSIVNSDWRKPSAMRFNTQQYIRGLEEMIELLNGHGSLVGLQGVLGTLYYQLYCETDNEAFYYKSGSILLKSIKHAERRTWIYAYYYEKLLFDMSFEKLLRHFFSNIRSELLYTEGMYTCISTHNYNTLFNDAEMLNGEAIYPSTAYLLYQVICAYMGLVQCSKSFFKQWLFKREASKVLKHLRTWAKRKSVLFPEIFDDHLYYLVGVASTVVGDTEMAVQSYEQAKSYGTLLQSFDIVKPSTIYVVPEDFVEKPKGRFDKNSMRFQPYRKCKKDNQWSYHNKLIFQDRCARVGRYMHY